MKVSSTDVAGRARIVDWNGLQASLLFCYRGAVDPALRRGPHLSPTMMAWLVDCGSLSVETPAGRLTARKGEWLVPRPRSGLRREFSDDARIISIHFQARWADGRAIFDEGLPVIFPSSAAPELTRQALRLLRLVRQQFGPVRTELVWAETTLSTHVELQSRFLSWLGMLVDSLAAAGLKHTRFGNWDERVRNGLFWIDRLPLRESFPKRELARRLDLGVSQLDRLFVRETGATPRRYFDSRRRDWARRALAQKGPLIKQIAYELGFQSAAHFSTWFRRAEGASPAEFRRRFVR